MLPATVHVGLLLQAGELLCHLSLDGRVFDRFWDKTRLSAKSKALIMLSPWPVLLRTITQVQCAG